MKIHRHTIDELERKARPGIVHHVRRFLTVYRGDPDDPNYNERRGKVFAGHVETIVKRPKAEFSARFHVGTAASETPFDGHLTLLGSGIYWGIEPGRRLADRITREKLHQYEGRDVSIALFDGRLSWRLWTHDGRWDRGEFAKWRDSSVRANPADIIWGPQRYSYEDLDTAIVALRMPEGIYSAVLKFRRQKLARPRGRRAIESFSVDVDVPKGIPSHQDHSGGWKGDRTYGFGVTITDVGDGWIFRAQQLAEAWVLRERGRSGFTEAQEVES